MVLALTGLFGGVFVASSHRNLPLALEIVMPLGVIFTGLFLVSLILRGEAAKFDEDQRLKNEAIKRYQPPAIEPPKKHAEEIFGVPSAIRSTEKKLEIHERTVEEAVEAWRDEGDGRSDNERLIEEGIKGAEHDQMRQANLRGEQI